MCSHSGSLICKNSDKEKCISCFTAVSKLGFLPQSTYQCGVGFLQTMLQAHIHTHTYTCSFSHMYAHTTGKQAHICTYTYMHGMHSCVLTCRLTCSYAHTRVRLYLYPHLHNPKKGYSLKKSFWWCQYPLHPQLHSVLTAIPSPLTKEETVVWTLTRCQGYTAGSSKA